LHIAALRFFRAGTEKPGAIALLSSPIAPG